ncbi:Down syndrome cell adhesion molecule-like protein 1, partial [Leptotrombidium deliense]
MTYTLDNLESGTRYNIYVTALSSFGIGDPSNIVRTKTNGDRINYANSVENIEEIPYYFQPLFMIPIITAIVIVIIVLVITYRIKSQYNAPDGFSTLSSKHLAYNTTTPRYSFDKTSKPLMSDPGN